MSIKEVLVVTEETQNYPILPSHIDAEGEEIRSFLGKTSKQADAAQEIVRHFHKLKTWAGVYFTVDDEQKVTAIDLKGHEEGLRNLTNSGYLKVQEHSYLLTHKFIAKLFEASPKI